MTRRTETLIKVLCMVILLGFVSLLLVESHMGLVAVRAMVVANAERDVRIESLSKQMPVLARYTTLVAQIQESAKEKLTAFQIVEMARIILSYCQLEQSVGLTPPLVLAVMERESGFNPSAVSSSKAYGIMQVLPSTAASHLKEMGYSNPTKDLLLNPIICTEVGLRVLIGLRKYWMAEGVDSWLITVSSYYWGTTVTWRLFLEKDKALLPSLEYGKGVIGLMKKWKEAGL